MIFLHLLAGMKRKPIGKRAENEFVMIKKVSAFQTNSNTYSGILV